MTFQHLEVPTVETQPNDPHAPQTGEPARPPVFEVSDLSVYYGAFRAVRNASVNIATNEITAFIGPSGCGKTTMLRCFNRMNDFIETERVEGSIRYHGVDTTTLRSTPPKCAGGSAWSSRSRTRSRRASSTTSRTGRA